MNRNKIIIYAILIIGIQYLISIFFAGAFLPHEWTFNLCMAFCVLSLGVVANVMAYIRDISKPDRTKPTFKTFVYPFLVIELMAAMAYFIGTI